jgi:hypothetical protein
MKTELVKRLCPSRDQRTCQLFTLEEMDDQKPSQFLRHIRSLVPDIPDNYIRILRTSYLPTAGVQQPRFHSLVHHRYTTHLWAGRFHRRSLSRRIHHRATVPQRTGRIAGERRRTSNTSGVRHGLTAREAINSRHRSLSLLLNVWREPYVPAPLLLQVFQSLHDLSYPGSKATAKLVAQRFVWPGIQKDCRT